MRRTKTIFRAEDPEKVKEVIRQWRVDRAAFFDRVEEFGRELGHELAVVGNGSRLWANHLKGDWRRDGGKYTPTDPKRPYGAVERTADIPPGWHYYVKEQRVEPHRSGRDKASKDAVAALAELNKTSPGDLRRPVTEAFDIPRSLEHSGFGFHSAPDASFDDLDDAVEFFITMGGGPFLASPTWDGGEFWRRIQLSQYHAILENFDAESIV